MEYKKTFIIKHFGETRGDCTCQYYIDVIGAPTVAEVINDIVLNHKGEWGSIRLGKLEIEYKHGKIISFPNEINKYLLKTVVKMSGYGGWSFSSYDLEI